MIKLLPLQIILLAFFMNLPIMNAQQQEGLTVYSSINTNVVKLMDTNGVVVKTWNTNQPTRYGMYMAPGGTLIRTCGSGFAIPGAHGGMYNKVQKWKSYLGFHFFYSNLLLASRYSTYAKRKRIGKSSLLQNCCRICSSRRNHDRYSVFL